MPSTGTRTHAQRLVQEADLELIQRWNAAETVRSRQPAGTSCDDLLECLGLLDAERPASS